MCEDLFISSSAGGTVSTLVSVRDRVIHAGDDGDLESAIGAQERALVEETERGAAVFGCDESDLRIVERAEAPDAGF